MFSPLAPSRGYSRCRSNMRDCLIALNFLPLACYLSRSLLFSYPKSVPLHDAGTMEPKHSPGKLISCIKCTSKPATTNKWRSLMASVHDNTLKRVPCNVWKHLVVHEHTRREKWPFATSPRTLLCYYVIVSQHGTSKRVLSLSLSASCSTTVCWNIREIRIPGLTSTHGNAVPRGCWVKCLSVWQWCSGPYHLA